MFFEVLGEDQDVVDVDGAEWHVPQDDVHGPLEAGRRVAKTETGEIEGEGSEGRRHCSLRNVFGSHGDLVVSFSEVQLGENLGTVEEGRNVAYVGQRVVVALRDVVEASIVSAGPVLPSFLRTI